MTEPTDYAGQQDPAEYGQPTPGVQLAMRRQEFNWTVEQVASQLKCTEKNVYALLAEAIAEQQLSLEQALDLPEELLGEVQDAFLDGEGELPSVAELAEQFRGRVNEGVLHCVRAALQAEFQA